MLPFFKKEGLAFASDGSVSTRAGITERLFVDQTRPNSNVIELISPLPLETCVSLLREGMDSPWSIFGNKPVIGRIVGTRLYARKRIWYGNSFQTRLSADLLEQAGRTQIRCRFAMHPFVKAYLIVWFGGVVCLGGALFVQSLFELLVRPLRAFPGVWLGVVIPIGLLTFGVGLVKFGQYIARNERQFLAAFLHNTLKARSA